MFEPRVINHGDKMQCPVCTHQGHYDNRLKDGLAFNDSIWFNPESLIWECYNCQ